MVTVKSMSTFLSTFFPLDLAEDWDNVGLLVGTELQPVKKMMICLTITPEVVAEAIKNQINFILCHHPLPFVGIKRITEATYEGGMLLDLIAARIAVYSAHTAYDSMHGGINEQIAHALGLVSLKPLVASAKTISMGSGRMGYFKKPKSLEEIVLPLKEVFGLDQINVVKGPDKPIESIAIACGSGVKLLERSIQLGSHLFITGEMSFHNILLAKGSGLSVILPGHYATERFAMKTLAQRLEKDFSGVEVMLSECDTDPGMYL